jgi:hypothetical protein
LNSWIVSLRENKNAFKFFLKTFKHKRLTDFVLSCALTECEAYARQILNVLSKKKSSGKSIVYEPKETIKIHHIKPIAIQGANSIVKVAHNLWKNAAAHATSSVTFAWLRQSSC